MGVLVEDLLALARLDERRDVVIGPVDLRPIARDAALDVRAASPLRSVTVIDTTIVEIPSPSRPELPRRTEPPGSRAHADEHVGHRPRGRRDALAAAAQAAARARRRRRPERARCPPITPVDLDGTGRGRRARSRRSCAATRTASGRSSRTCSATRGGSPPRTRRSSCASAWTPRADGLDRGRRPRRGHPRPDQGEDLPAVLARRHLAHPRDRRHRSRPVDRRVDRRCAARVASRRRHPRRRRDLPRRVPARRGSGCRRAPALETQPIGRSTSTTDADAPPQAGASAPSTAAASRTVRRPRLAWRNRPGGTVACRRTPSVELPPHRSRSSHGRLLRRQRRRPRHHRRRPRHDRPPAGRDAGDAHPAHAAAGVVDRQRRRRVPDRGRPVARHPAPGRGLARRHQRGARDRRTAVRGCRAGDDEPVP